MQCPSKSPVRSHLSAVTTSPEVSDGMLSAVITQDVMPKDSRYPQLDFVLKIKSLPRILILTNLGLSASVWLTLLWCCSINNSDFYFIFPKFQLKAIKMSIIGPCLEPDKSCRNPPNVFFSVPFHTHTHKFPPVQCPSSKFVSILSLEASKPNGSSPTHK